MKLTRFSAVALSVIATINFTGCGSGSDSSPVAPDDNSSITDEVNQTDDVNQSDDVNQTTYSVQPFLRVAELDGNWDSVGEIATIIAQYIDETNESEALGVEKYPTNWVIAGAENGVDSSILGVPYITEDNSTQKVKIVELCNKQYANMAMSAGTYHAPALPCQIAVHSDNGKTYVDILEPNAIFSLFFTDMPEENKEMLKTTASQVKNEIVGMVEASLINSGKTFSSKDEALGPKYDESKFQYLFDTYQPYDVVDYVNDNGKIFTQEDIDNLTEEILTQLGNEDAPSSVVGLSVNDWRSAIEDALPIPGAKVIEACSPTYAMQAISLGVHHATALPCEIAVTVADNNKTLQVSYLNPNYMFGVLFADSMEMMSDEQKQQFSTLPSTVLGDLKKIVNSAVDEAGDLRDNDIPPSIPEEMAGEVAGDKLPEIPTE